MTHPWIPKLHPTEERDAVYQLMRGVQFPKLTANRYLLEALRELRRLRRKISDLENADLLASPLFERRGGVT